MGELIYSFETGRYRDAPEGSYFLCWLPDGNTFLFRRRDDMFLGRADTGEERRLASDPLPNEASLSPDGRTLYFARTDMSSDLWLITLE